MPKKESSRTQPVLEVRNLAISYKTRKREVPAVRDVSFSVHPQETVGLVGESGCGKSTIAFGILDFLGINGRVTGGSIKFMGRELVGRPKKELRRIRGNQISMVYQDPMQALNPSLTIGRQLAEVLTTHQNVPADKARRRCVEMLERVYMPDAQKVLSRYPHMLSGGQQRDGSLKSLLGLGGKQYIKAVDGISLDVKKGSTLGIVGESGCGKSTLIKAIIGLEKLSGGKAELLGVDISMPVSRRGLAVIRELQMVFQNPDATLNPSFTVGKQIERPLRRFKTVDVRHTRREVERLLKSVKLAPYYYDRYPRQLSGGEKQRVGIARALASQPSMVICDEPVSALDVSVQAAVLNLLNAIKEDFDTTLIFIAHDLSVVRFISDYIAVMYLGRVVEFGPVDCIYTPPYHPYTEALLSAVPIPDPTAGRRQIRLAGEVPSALNPPVGCRFHTRCPRRNLAPEGGRPCTTADPPWRCVEGEHHVACHIPVEVLADMEPVVRQHGGKS